MLLVLLDLLLILMLLLLLLLLLLVEMIPQLVLPLMFTVRMHLQLAHACFLLYMRIHTTHLIIMLDRIHIVCRLVIRIEVHAGQGRIHEFV